MHSSGQPEFWRGRRVWLSGHTGFKGSWLALWLLHWGAVVEGYALDPLQEPGGVPLYQDLGLAANLAHDERADLADLERLVQRLQAFEHHPGIKGREHHAAVFHDRPAFSGNDGFASAQRAGHHAALAV